MPTKPVEFQIQDSLLNEADQSDNAIERALGIQALASAHGFDWPEVAPVFDKIIEELNELKHELEQVGGQATAAQRKAISAEYGDVLFACLNLSRFINVDPASALQLTNDKFSSRFQYIEQVLAEEGKQMSEVSLSQLDLLWDQAKEREKSNT